LQVIFKNRISNAMEDGGGRLTIGGFLFPELVDEENGQPRVFRID
jgi:hypothetical protein